MTTANKITIARILMIPVFVMMVVYYGKSVQRGHPHEWERGLAILVFLLASASDGIDGYIARHYNQKSHLGEVLDPIADKGLLLSAIITLSFSNWRDEFPVWFPVLVITRDVVILTGAVVLHYFLGRVVVKPSWTGKAATATQMLAISCYLLQMDFFKTTITIGDSIIPIDFLYIPVVLAGFFTLISGIGYVMGGIVQLQAGGHGNARP
ncbi:MAG TPA: CDP-diacylglycerol--glycerol-3-phosphate 3-phosphatidyltransferase [Chthoniobacteraceae bacterium]|nr:CDP-diacylglycerol--glycerol-3-phosphate 3-phosphatidyltransferase [Chthoniobacteraceae bacterium]